MVEESSVELHVLELAMLLPLIPDHREPSRQDPQRVPSSLIGGHTLVPPAFLLLQEFSPHRCALVGDALERIRPLVALLRGVALPVAAAVPYGG